MKATPFPSMATPYRWPYLLLPALVLLAGCCCSRPAKQFPQPPPPSASKPVPAPTAAPQASTAVAAEPKDNLPPGVAKPPAPFEGEGWEAMFDGKTLTGWRETDFAGHGAVECRDKLILLKMGDPFTGVNWTNDFPKMNYEVAFDSMRVMGSDFFCGLTVPVGDSFCSLIVGGWGGSLVGISSLDGMDASENQTSRFFTFDQGRWYRIRLRITEGRIEGWLDADKIVDVVTTNKRISLRPGDIEMSKPFGIASYQTTAALREIKMRHVDKPSEPPKKNALYD